MTIGDSSWEPVWPAAIHAYLFHGADADDLGGGVVVAIDLYGAGYEFAGDLIDAFFLGDDGGDSFWAHFVMQAVGGEDQHVAGQEGKGGGVGGDEHFRAERADEHVAGFGLGHFAGGDKAHFALLVDPGVVLGYLPGLSSRTR